MKNIVYRNSSIRTQEHPSVLAEGFKPRDATATFSPAYHVTHGNKIDTQYISVTRNLEVAIHHQQPDIPIYVIDLDKVSGQVYGFTIQEVAEKYLRNPYSRNLAIRAFEILIEGEIPSEAIIDTIPYEKYHLL
jgi:hypothetical protein